MIFSQKQYLGEDLEELRGRTILDENSQVMLPIVSLPGVVLIPSQIIPLSLFHQHTIAMMKSVIEANKTFGVVASRYVQNITIVIHPHVGLVVVCLWGYFEWFKECWRFLYNLYKWLLICATSGTCITDIENKLLYFSLSN